MLLRKKTTFFSLIIALGISSSAYAELYGFNNINPYKDEEKILKMDNPPRHIINYRKEMRNNINMLSAYAKKQNKGFAVLVHDDEEVLGKSKWEYDLEGYNRAIREKTNAKDDTFLDHTPIQEPFTSSVDGIVKNNALCGKNKLSSELTSSNLVIFSADHCVNELSYDKAINNSITDNIVFHGFIRKEFAFNRIKKQPIIKENASNIYKLSEAKNLNIFIDDNLYKDKQSFISDIANSNYDIVIINPLFQNKEALTKEEVAPLKLKKNGTKRLLIALQNISETKPSDYFWGRKWSKGNPSWIKRESFSQKDAFIVEYWNDEWIKIISNYLKSIVNTGYDGVFFTGLENHNYFEKQTPLN